MRRRSALCSRGSMTERRSSRTRRARGSIDRVIASSVENREIGTRDEGVAWFGELFDAVPDLHMEEEDVAIAGEPGRERITVRWQMTGTFSGSYMGIEPTGRPLDLRGMDLSTSRMAVSRPTTSTTTSSASRARSGCCHPRARSVTG